MKTNVLIALVALTYTSQAWPEDDWFKDRTTLNDLLANGRHKKSKRHEQEVSADDEKRDRNVRIIPLKDSPSNEEEPEENHEIGPEKPIDFQFLIYANKFNKDYRTMHEYNRRKSQFAKNHKMMQELREHLEHQYIEHNQYSDWFDEEL